MKGRAFLALAASFWLVPLPVRAECTYFRVKYKLAKCRAVTPKEAKAIAAPAEAAEEGDPDLKEPAEGPLAKIVCSCDYALSGSDPLCDLDKSEDKTSYIPAPNLHDTCARGKNLCDEVCLRQIH